MSQSPTTTPHLSFKGGHFKVNVDILSSSYLKKKEEERRKEKRKDERKN